ncbi:ATP-binding protein [Streptomyces sp. 1331.2]|uniref:ATP-binding protein n=1 Tax=Streptomyces sp. 1331.2 TaxID=1938835 RepID=UPI000BDAF6FA|nr:ATP-binding protein [Streptomyces sp. 1331.2]SOB85257.1 Anti-sigma regulatory factor (Ser/Thr protein kinase) [Streptomyces sp. 1331.2]
MPGMLEKPPAPTNPFSWWLPRHHKSAGFARRLLRTFLTAQPDGERFLDTGELVLGELVTNAVLHAKSPRGRLIYVQFEFRPDALRIEVHDADSNRPSVPRPVSEEDETGRGLWFVSQLAAGWGCCPRVGGIGKVMWALIDGGTE